MTLLDLVQNRTGFKKQSASTWKGPCPKCGGTKRFVVWIHKDIFKCRDCDFKGDLIKYLREVEGYTCREAFLALGRDCGSHDCPAYEKCKGNTAPRRVKAASATPPAAKGEAWQPRHAEDPAGLWCQKGFEFVTWAHEQLLSDPAQLQYLASRGLPLEVVKRERLGFNPGAVQNGKLGPLFKQRAAWGLENKWNEEDKRWINVLPIQRGIIIPSFRGDDLYRIRIRRLDEDLAEYSENNRPPKYLFLEGSGKGLVLRNPDAKAFLVVESDLCDLLVNHLAGDIVCSVALTSCGIRPDTASAAVLANAVCILNALDFDPRTNPTTGKHESPGGQNARWWQKHFPRSERYPVPIGKDPGDAYKEGVDLREWVVLGLPVSLQPRQQTLSPEPKSGKTQEAKKVEFDQKKAQQQISDTYSRISSSCPPDAMVWLETNRKDVLDHLKKAEASVELAFQTENEADLAQWLDKWMKWSLAAWKVYESRPPVIEVQEHLFG